MGRSAASITDDFNRASLGANWTQTNAWNGSVTTNSSLYFTAAGSNRSARYTAATPSSDQWAQIRVQAPGGNIDTSYFCGVKVRSTGANDAGTDGRSHYGLIWQADASDGSAKTTALWRMNSGTNTVLATTKTLVIALNDTIELEVYGSNPVVLVPYRNGAVITALCNVGSTYEDSSGSRISSGGGVGIFASVTLLGDDLAAGDYSAAAGPAIPVFMNQYRQRAL